MRALLVISLMCAASAATAQSAPATTTASDRWSPVPAAAASIAPDAGSSMALPGGDARPSHFKFKQRRDYRPMRNTAQEQSGKAPVMGTEQIGPDGRPPIACSRTPMDPACH